MTLNKLVLGAVMLSSTLMAGCSCSEQIDKLNSSIKSNIKTLDTKFEQKFNQINRDVHTIQTDIKSAKDEVATMQTDMKSAKDEVATMQTDIKLAKSEAARAHIRLNNQSSAYHK
ncbi:LPP leucine zipper domain-containing protein [Candidatus Palibaumannia cicadellinicola]|uniref:Major outer membrane lipoprotein Lpp n=1 Tax=Baumannia cicadellinicola subsp. Homalodisca coagulata TaxID=374463 RepID=Q1LTZ8_BAUCH|nr:LPP leucine zipper domain-containing protein [Candidatus Baumannia cicadellinicola]ABF13927.1 major outer membrane lipoprotein [Baumannia cicadellinicola str. Hc (Homalodisca coagulata)]MBS0032622.1 hypothetical protein [Candidatus Baumannia cicadellinicola]MCJ7462453.1 hypothetical protein [Candidatus Baumannia cicadellinicola]MCJ7462856.1 hypothetical protein [Candidatus Baumannia cicadellinicola]